MAKRGPTKQSPTVPTQTLLLNCGWCLELRKPWGLSSAHWWWLSKFMTPSTTKPASPEKGTNKRKGGSASCWTNHQYKVFCAGQLAGLRPWTCYIWYGTGTAHATPSRWSFVPHLTLLLFVSCWHLDFLQHGPGHVLQCQASGWISLFPSWEQKDQMFQSL